MQRLAGSFVKSRYTIYSSVSDMIYELGWPPYSQRRQEARLILFYKIINGLAQVPFEGVLVKAYKGTRRKHNIIAENILIGWAGIRTTDLSKTGRMLYH